MSRRLSTFPGMTPGLTGPTRLVDVRASEETGDVDFKTAPVEVPVTPAFLKATEQDRRSHRRQGRYPARSAGRRCARPDYRQHPGAVAVDHRRRRGPVRRGPLQRRRPDRGGQIWLPDADRDTSQRANVRVLRVGGDMRAHDVEIVLIPGGAIAGRSHSAGEPFQGVLVRPLRLRQNGGRTVATLAASPRLTDDHGRYRLFGLPPGSVLIVASLDATERPAGRSRAPGFAPCTTRTPLLIESAQSVQLELGATIAGVDVTFAVSSTWRARGRKGDHGGGESRNCRSRGARRSHRSGSVAAEPRGAIIGPGGRSNWLTCPR